MKFSVIVVCLNPGDKMKDTIQSILMQKYGDYEIVVKDGGSTDGSVDNLPDDPRIHLYRSSDTGIYDAMNQAVAYAKGEYLIFLNCGDSFHDENVLSGAAKAAEEHAGEGRLLLYGRIYNEKQDSFITPSPVINGFTCYRNVPCHQSCIYDASLCREKPYEPAYKIRADYEHFLWCYYKGHAKCVYLDMTVADYEGGGFSETAENLKRSAKEHEAITKIYMTPGELFKYKAILACTLAPLRRRLAESRTFSAAYHKLTDAVYRMRG